MLGAEPGLSRLNPGSDLGNPGVLFLTRMVIGWSNIIGDTVQTPLDRCVMQHREVEEIVPVLVDNILSQGRRGQCNNTIRGH
eukprot:gene3705-biopygen7142